MSMYIYVKFWFCTKTYIKSDSYKNTIFSVMQPSKKNYLLKPKIN